MSLETAVKQSAALRGQRKFSEAVVVIDSALATASENDDLWVNANVEGLYAAEEGDMPREARRFAAAIARTDPDLPSIQKYKTLP